MSEHSLFGKSFSPVTYSPELLPETNILPLRQSLVESVVQLMKDQISAGRWIDHLPGERTLSHDLQVSRPTLRQALKILEQQAWISSEHGKKRTIVSYQQVNRIPEKTQVIALLTPVSLDALPPFVLFWIDEIRTNLAKVGHRLELHVSSVFASMHPERVVDGIVRNNRASLWILLLSSYSLQRWFYERQIPCITAGSCLPEFKMPSIDINYRAACRHAAGAFHQKGHKQLAVVIPNEGLTGDAESELGFVEGCRNHLAPMILRHDGTRDDIIRKLEGALQRKTPPTAFLVARAGHTLTVLSFLLSKGAAFNGDYALIARDNEAFLNFLTPSVARYRADRHAFARRFSRAIMQVARGGSLPPKPIRLIPTLQAGSSL